MTRSASSCTPSHPEAAPDGLLSEQAALPSLSSLSTLWLPPDALAQTWGYLAADVPIAPIFFVCALAFQGLASEASALHHYHQGPHPRRGRARYLLHTARELVEACRSWDGVVDWLTGRPGQHLPLEDSVRASLLKEVREQVARLWLLQGQVHTELVQVCLEVGLPLPHTKATPVVPSSLSAVAEQDERPTIPLDRMPTGEAAADQQERAVAQPTTAFTYPPSANTGRVLS
jgi:hypothetical protein